MAKVIAYEVQVNGIQKVIRNQEDLTAAVKETTAAYKKADFGTDEYKAAEKELATLTNLQKKFRDDSKETARQAEITAEKAKNSYRGMSAELNSLRQQYRNLSEEERGIFGPGLLKRINQLDTSLKDIDASMGQYQRNVGNYASALNGIGGFDFASFATIPGAIAAVGTAAVTAGKYVFEMTAEVRKLQGELSNLTDATGEQLDEFTARVLGIAESFKVTTEEVSVAANAVSKQLGIPFEEALTKIEEGFVAGSNAQGDFLDQVREYPAFFKEAGLTADQFFAVINKSVTAGIYSDKGVDTIKEVNLRLRENTVATQKALEGIGLSSEEVAKTIEEKGIGAAIARVSEQMGKLRADSPAVGTAIADIFGGPGEDAGLAFLLTLKDLDQATGSLIDTSNEFQQSQLRTLEINQEFARVQVEVANAVGGTGTQFSQLGTIIETKALQVLLFFINNIKILWAALQPLKDALFEIGLAFGVVDEKGSVTVGFMKVLSATFKAAVFPVKVFGQFVGYVVEQISSFARGVREVLEWIGLLDEDTKKATTATARQAEETTKVAEATAKVVEETKKADTSTKTYTSSLDKYTKATKQAAVATDAFAKGSIADLKKEVSDLQKSLEGAAPGSEQGILTKLIGAENALKEAEEFRKQLRERLATPDPNLQPIDLLPPKEIQAKRTDEFVNDLIKRGKDANKVVAETAVDNLKIIEELQAGIFGGINQALDLLTEASNMRRDSEIASLEERYGKEIELAEGNAARQEQLQIELDAAKALVEKREFERQKRYRRAAALTSYAEGVINILSAPTTIPDPFGTLFKAVRIGFLTATLGQQLSSIDQQQAARGIIIDGVARGAAHSDPDGGIPIVANGQRVMIESGEAVDTDEFGGVAVINRRSTAAYSDLLSSIRGVSFPGKRDYLSALNSSRNYGTAFMATGGLIKPPDAVSVADIAARPGGSASTVNLSADSIRAIAGEVAVATAAGSKAGVESGLNQATRRAEREARLSKRTGV